MSFGKGLNVARVTISPFPTLFTKTSSSPFPKQQNLNSANLNKFADDNLKFDENGRKFSKRVENTVDKGEISRYEQFLLFLQCFQKTSTADT